ncbi:hypothetical protein [Chondromyces crocatus]|nr:hypothetical protein [Chondromyces crocatus]
MLDAKKWRRVRIWTQPTRATYRYGDDHYAVATVLYTPIVGRDDPDACLEDFWKKHMPLAEAYGVRVKDSKLLRGTQEVDGDVKPIVVKVVDGSVDSMFSSEDYLGAVAAYQSWPGTCLVHAFAVKAGNHRELAAAVRTRWIGEGLPRLHWLEEISEAPETKAR